MSPTGCLALFPISSIFFYISAAKTNFSHTLTYHTHTKIQQACTHGRAKIETTVYIFWVQYRCNNLHSYLFIHNVPEFAGEKVFWTHQTKQTTMTKFSPLCWYHTCGTYMSKLVTLYWPTSVHLDSVHWQVENPRPKWVNKGLMLPSPPPPLPDSGFDWIGPRYLLLLISRWGWVIKQLSPRTVSDDCLLIFG
jgi:hypothetical protein